MKRFLEKIQSEVGGRQISKPSEDPSKQTSYAEMIDLNVSPLRYNGHVITTHKELRDKISIDGFEEVIHGHIRKIREKENETNVPEIDRDPANKIDPKFF